MANVRAAFRFWDGPFPVFPEPSDFWGILILKRGVSRYQQACSILVYRRMRTIGDRRLLFVAIGTRTEGEEGRKMRPEEGVY
jgi:hypothetical protein